ncbi:hypothetical protein EV182_004651, partial [Spiromyces aspiralis]
GHAGSFIGRTMFVFGGESEGGVYDENLYAYNVANSTWYRVPISNKPLPGRKGHTIVSYGSTIVVFGGTANGRYYNDLIAFDVQIATKMGPRWSYISPSGITPKGRAGHSCDLYNSCIYMFGGTNSEECFNDLWSYSFADRQWTHIYPRGATPPARYGHASAIVNDCIFIMGGRTLKGEALNDFFVYKISAQRWFTFPEQSSRWPHRVDPVFTAMDGKLLLYSGNPGGNNDISTIHVLDTYKIKIMGNSAEQNRGGSTEIVPPSSHTETAQDAKKPVQHNAEPAVNGRAEALQSLEKSTSLPTTASHGQEQGPSKVAERHIVAGYHTPDVSQEDIPTGRDDDSTKAGRRLLPEREVGPEDGRVASISPPQGPSDSAASASGGGSLHKMRPNSRRSIILNQGFPLTSALSSSASSETGVSAPPSSTHPSASRNVGGDNTLTIALRNRSAPSSNTNDPHRDADQDSLERGNATVNDSNLSLPTVNSAATNDNGSLSSVGDRDVTTHNHEEVKRAWELLELKTSDAGASGSFNSPHEVDLNDDHPSHQQQPFGALLPILLKMKRDLTDTKQQLKNVSRVAIEKVNEAERGRMIAVREAIYMKARARAISQRNPDLLAKINAKRIAQIEAELV